MYGFCYSYSYGMPSSFDFGSATPCLENLVFWSDALTDNTLTDKSGEGNDCAVIQSNCLYFNGTAKVEYQLDDILIHYVDEVEINYSTDNSNWQVADINWQYFEIDYVNNKILIGEGFTGWLSLYNIASLVGEDSITFISESLAVGVDNVTINKAPEVYEGGEQWAYDLLRDGVLLQDGKLI